MQIARPSIPIQPVLTWLDGAIQSGVHFLQPYWAVYEPFFVLVLAIAPLAFTAIALKHIGTSVDVLLETDLFPEEMKGVFKYISGRAIAVTFWAASVFSMTLVPWYAIMGLQPGWRILFVLGASIIFFPWKLLKTTVDIFSFVRQLF